MTDNASLQVYATQVPAGEEIEGTWNIDIEKTLAQRGWMLALDRAQFIRSVCNELRAKFAESVDQIPAIAILRATIHQYCFVLYAACASTNPTQQQRAFEELWYHLYRVAIFKMHDADLAKDSTQQALINIWRHLDQCIDKGCFLNWCNLVLLNVIREYYRKQMSKIVTRGEVEWVQKEVRLDLMDESSGTLPPHKNGESVGLENVARDEIHVRLIEAIRACLNNQAQQGVIIATFLEDRSVKQIAEEMQTTTGNVQVMKSRALKILRLCEDFIHLYEEWLHV